MVHMEEIAFLLDGASVKPPLVLMQSPSGYYLSLLVHMVLNYHSAVTILTLCLNIEHIPSVPSPE